MGLFDSRLKFPIHMLQLALVVGALGVSVVRIFLPNAPRGRSGTMALGMAAKSLIIILYQVLTEHVSAMKRWASLKANLILNGLEIVFWAAVVYMSIQSNTQQQCVGTTCTLGWVVVVVGILLSMVAGYATIISWLDFRYFKGNGVTRGSMRQQQLPLHSRCNSAQSQLVETIEVQEQRKLNAQPAVAPVHFSNSGNGGVRYEQEQNNQYARQYAQQYQQQYQQYQQQPYNNQYHTQYLNQNPYQQRA